MYKLVYEYLDMENRLIDKYFSNNQIKIFHLDYSKKKEFDESFFKLLSLNEKRYYLNLKNYLSKKQFLYTRAYLKILLSNFINITPDKIDIQLNKYGKPFINNELKINFNVSHSGNKSLFAFSKKYEVGIDIEKIDYSLSYKKILSRFHENEIFHLSNSNNTKLFFDYWTAKEAFIKMVGKGLYIPLDSFYISKDWKIYDESNLNSVLYHFYNEKEYSQALVIGNYEYINSL